ncbi:MAG: hypothetical protein GY804_03930 [Alphaproteobacteria bacterium]|nr:hypothetical protein [Alphaproteobacteria bacterium]
MDTEKYIYDYKLDLYCDLWIHYTLESYDPPEAQTHVDPPYSEQYWFNWECNDLEQLYELYNEDEIELLLIEDYKKQNEIMY